MFHYIACICVDTAPGSWWYTDYLHTYIHTYIHMPTCMGLLSYYCYCYYHHRYLYSSLQSLLLLLLFLFYYYYYFCSPITFCIVSYTNFIFPLHLILNKYFPLFFSSILFLKFIAFLYAKSLCQIL
jgi:hypothetical protein